MLRLCLWALLLSSLSAGSVSAASIDAIRVSSLESNTRVVFDLSDATAYKIFTLNNPNRLVVDIKADRLLAVPTTEVLTKSPIKQIRHGKRPDATLRVVFDLDQQVVAKSFVIPASGTQKARLVVDMPAAANNAVPKTARLVPAPVVKAAPAKTVPKPALTSLKRPSAPSRNVIVAIDPGHGGKDPGAIGNKGTREKDVVLAIARKLAAEVNAQPGMSAVLIRNDDRFITLRGRIKKARQLKADVFLSIHADAFHDRRAHGSSVYVLSPNGASSEAARILAERENQADLIGGVDLEGKDATLKRVLVDLSQTATIDDSNELARDILHALGKVGRTRKVERAGFAVLKSPDIPSVLIETAFISNPNEELRLRSSKHQQELARAIVRGLTVYFQDHAPENTLLASKAGTNRHTIKPGETLSGIAHRYQVSVKALRALNALNNDRIQAGQTLVIPTQLGS